MYEIYAEATLDATEAEAWAIESDVAGWPRWNSHEQAARLDGPFEAGTHGWSKPRGGPAANWVLTEAQAPRSWSSRSKLPGGALTGTRTFTGLPDGRLRCTNRMTVTGWLQPLFRIWFGPRIRHDMIQTFAELEAEVARRRDMAS